MKTISINQIKYLNKTIGHFFFSPSTIRFFHSRVGQTAYVANGMAYFVTSEQREHDTPRKYTIRKANLKSGDICTVGEFQAYDTNAKAMSVLKTLLKQDGSNCHGDQDECDVCVNKCLAQIEQEKLVLVEQ